MRKKSEAEVEEKRRITWMIFRGAALTASSHLSSIEGAEEEEGEEESDKKEQNEDDDEENGEEDEEEFK